MIPRQAARASSAPDVRDARTMDAEDIMSLTLDEIVDRLDRHGQRATYGAVARLLGQSPRGLLRDRERGRKYTWIVNRTTGLPTGYADDQLDPRLRESGPVIATDGELRQWLERVG
jgi:hypothetical protein